MLATGCFRSVSQHNQQPWQLVCVFMSRPWVGVRGKDLGEPNKASWSPFRCAFTHIYNRDNTLVCIQAERRTASAGLGSVGSNYAGLYSSAGSYKETLKQLTKARYEETYKT